MASLVLTCCPRVVVREKSEEQGMLRCTHIPHHVSVWSWRERGEKVVN